ncbi:MAG: pirin family protein [Myxococcota bacterium]
MTVRRPLPTRTHPAVGPFVLLDHFGPVPAPREKLPAHPHAGIEVMTYLIEGANEHTDSLGNVGQIGAGGAQWMKSGSGILHTERNLLERSSVMHGLQIWARMPIAKQARPTTAPIHRTR